MPSKSWSATDFLGLTPAIDVRRSDKFYALGGKNYFFDSIGPKSGFANRMVTPYVLTRPAHVEGFRVNTDNQQRAFTLTQDAVLEWSEALGGYKILYALPLSVDQAYRWTHGYLNGYLYFCHPRVGILVMDIETDFVLPLNEPGAPERPIAMCINNARVVCVDEELLWWSGPSDGQDWTPRLSGAGYQKIKNHVSGDVITVSSYGRGVLTWTTGGVMRSEFTNEQFVFNHKALNTEYRPVNSFCVQQIDDSTVIILDQRGLFKTQGLTPEPYAPLFNEFLIEYIRKNRLTEGQNLRLEWDNLRRLMYLSVSMSWENPIYESAFVYYPPMDKWGTFNEEHFGILPVRFSVGDRNGDFFGFVSNKGRHHYWRDGGSREVAQVSTALNSVYPRIQTANNVDPESGGLTVSSTIQASPVAECAAAKPAGFFANGGIVNVAANLIGLDARIVLGLLTFDLGETLDQLTEVNQVGIGSSETSGSGDLSLNLPLTDWTHVSIADDQGLSPRNPVSCQLRILSSIDGRGIRDSAIPLPTYIERGMSYFACTTQGLYHMLELTAVNAGEYFHLGHFSLTATYAGKLQ